MTRTDLSKLPDQLAVMAYDDPLVEAHGYRPDHPVVVWAYAPILGPSATLLYLHLGAIIDAATTPVAVNTAELMAGIGIGRGLARNSPAARTVARLAHFDIIRRHRAVIAVRRALPPLPEYRRRQQLPPGALSTYHHLIAATKASACRPVPLSAHIPLSCRGCSHPLTAHSAQHGCRQCDCPYGRP